MYKMFWFFVLLVTVIYLCIRKFIDQKSDSVTCLVGKVALVTGGNSGLGYATSLLLASRGCKVIIADRDNAEESRDKIINSTGNDQVFYKYLDLSSLQKVREFAEDIKKTENKLDILINNAGIGVSPKLTTADGLNTVMQVNYFGAFLLTHLLIDLLKASSSARVVFLGSLSIFTSNLTFNNLNLTKEDGKTFKKEEYSNSKLCNVIASKVFGRKLQKYGITVNSVDPGAVRTAIFTNATKINRSLAFDIPSFLILLIIGQDPIDGAQIIFDVATNEKFKNKTSQHYSSLCPWFTPSILEDQEFCAEIWKRTESLIKLKSQEKL